RTPLTNIIGFNELLSSPLIGPLNPKQREYLSDITSSSKSLLAIIDDILDLATIDAGAVELKLAPLPVSLVIDAAIEGVRDRAIQSRLT
ncbi:sensor histidine kinase, partial [Vibrio parahaemolyticus]